MLVFCHQAGCRFVVFYPLFLIIRVLNIHHLEFLWLLHCWSLFAHFCWEHGMPICAFILCLIAGLFFVLLVETGVRPISFNCWYKISYVASLVSLCDGFDAEAVLGSDVPADLIDDWFCWWSCLCLFWSSSLCLMIYQSWKIYIFFRYVVLKSCHRFCLSQNLQVQTELSRETILHS